MSEHRTDEDRSPIRVFLVDDHDVVRRCVRDLLELSGGIEVVGEDGSARSAAAHILAARPDTAVVDLRLGDGSGIEVCREVGAVDAGIALLVLTADDDEQAAVASVLAGARGYVLKLVRGADLVASIRRVAAGEGVLDPGQRAHAVAWLERERTEAAQRLSPAESEVLALITAGCSDPQIADSLGVSTATAVTHVSDLLSQLGFPSRAFPGGDGRRRDEQPWV